ncbi:putative NAD(P)H quinone oxidoreductase, PIG3 family [Nitrosovibrio sp. Nv17]|nr:putative NAD(P)H quinone oxidoreductase, PIG3 family [Nitrosovibrio sp. Nv17]
MLAIDIPRPGGAGVLVPVVRPIPPLARDEILILVEAAGVNRPDVLQRRGLYPPPPGASTIPGLEVAGSVVGTGDGVSRFSVGERVCALVASGGYAEYCVAHEGHALRIPQGFGAVEAAALPETFFTVWANVFQRGRLAAGETVLVHGGCSGIGTAAILLCKAFGAAVVATAGSEAKRAACLALGANLAIDHRTQDFVEETLAFTGGRGADVIVDIVGGDYVVRNYRAAAVEGRIIQIGLMGGRVRELDLMPMLSKRLTHTGSTLRTRSVADKARIASELERDVWPLLEAGKLRPLIDGTFPLEEAARAHARMESGAHVGKIVLTTGAGRGD